MSRTYNYASVCSLGDIDSFVMNAEHHRSVIDQIHNGGSYELHKSLSGHKHGVTSLKFSPDGRFLASGGMDNRVRIWTTNSGKCLQTIRSTILGPITDITWAANAKRQQALIFACADGMIYIYCNVGDRFEGVIALPAHPHTVESIDYDPHHHRLASCAGEETKVWNIIEDWCTELHARDVQCGVTARVVQFLNKGESVAITYLETSNIALWTVAPWKMIWGRTFSGKLITPAHAGHSQISPDGKSVLIDNIRNRMDAYMLSTGEHLTTFHAPLAHPGKPKHVAYNYDGSIVIQGSDKGIMYVSDFASAAPIQMLLHGNNGQFVQVVTMLSHADNQWMASGTSGEVTPSIMIWKKVNPIRHGTIVKFGLFLPIFIIGYIYILDWHTLQGRAIMVIAGKNIIH
ncbi:hypothetical protein M422DRAFT_255290 [Sphaerobolus stellatus SS14]|uniref:WD40 repeat-like protein n=1 Tax=Sphaerobolus stellatus (strain SS14) TaxID=990650 RepID=A0A0C9VT38_SPHS4|nr:hypothetical protein M422DRAFT_255290 [Sphaerobolus stellatus SS14]